MKKKQLLIVIICFVTFPALAGNPPAEVVKIWDYAAHNAFTDLIRYGNKFYCTFREAPGHIPAEEGKDDGKIRVLVSEDGEKWESFALVGKKDYDLRDPKLSVTPDNKLMLLYGGSIYGGSKLQGCQTHVSFLGSEEKTFSGPVPIEVDKKIRTSFDWLWRVTWYQGKGYGVIYRKNHKREDTVYLVETNDGIHYTFISALKVGGFPNEATVQVSPSREMKILLRREDGDHCGYLGSSLPPYRQWDWKNLGIRLGGPNFIPIDNTNFIMGTRSHLSDTLRTALYILTGEANLKPVVELPSGGDTSYPGMVIFDNTLWVSYYASHEGKSKIYLAKVPVETINGVLSQ